jgi:hypothetical protein
MLHTIQISESEAKYRYYKCENSKYGTMLSFRSNPKWLWWQITLRVADNIYGLSVSYRKKIVNLIR